MEMLDLKQKLGREDDKAEIGKADIPLRDNFANDKFSQYGIQSSSMRRQCQKHKAIARVQSVRNALLWLLKICKSDRLHVEQCLVDHPWLRRSQRTRKPMLVQP